MTYYSIFCCTLPISKLRDCWPLPKIAYYGSPLVTNKPRIYNIGTAFNNWNGYWNGNRYSIKSMLHQRLYGLHWDVASMVEMPWLYSTSSWNSKKVYRWKLSTTVLHSTRMAGNKHACCAVTGPGLIIQMYCISSRTANVPNKLVAESSLSNKKKKKKNPWVLNSTRWQSLCPKDETTPFN